MEVLIVLTALLKIKLSKMSTRVFSFHYDNNILKKKYVEISNARLYMFSKFDMPLAVHHIATSNSQNNHPTIAIAPDTVELHPALGLG